MSTTNEETTQVTDGTENITEGTEAETEEMEEVTEETDVTVEQTEPAQDTEVPPHPYAAELSAFKPTPEQLVKKEPVKSPSLKDAPVTVVDTEELLKDMLAKLESVSELAFDMEYNIAHSFRGVTNFFQISTRTEDFIIDPVSLKDHLSALNKVFTDAKVVKIMYGGKMTRLEGLQRDFGIFVINYFDVSIAEDELGLKKKRSRSQRQDLSKLVSSITCVVLDQNPKKFDKSVRPPFSKDLIDYKREETRSLLHVYDVISNRLLEKGLLEKVYARCKEFCEVLWYPEKYARRPNSSKSLCTGFAVQGKLNEMQEELVETLTEWRWNTAKEKDRGLQFVLSNNHVHNIIRVLPNNRSTLELCCFNEASELVKDNVDEILGFITKAKAKFPGMKVDNKEVLARLRERVKQGRATWKSSKKMWQMKGGVRQPGPTLPWRPDGQFIPRGPMHPAGHQRPRMGMRPIFRGGPRGPPVGPFPHRPLMGYDGPMRPQMGYARPMRPQFGHAGPMRPRGRGRFQPY